MKVVYIAGKFRGANHWEIHRNVFEAEALALEVWKIGMVAICPHANTAHFQDTMPDGTWLEGDLEILSRCDALLAVDNWEDSEGAKKEIEFAYEHKIPVFFDAPSLLAWKEGKCSLSLPCY